MATRRLTGRICPASETSTSAPESWRNFENSDSGTTPLTYSRLVSTIRNSTVPTSTLAAADRPRLGKYAADGCAHNESSADSVCSFRGPRLVVQRETRLRGLMRSSFHGASIFDTAGGNSAGRNE